MSEIKLVNKVDEFIRLKNVIVSCTDKEGLVSNRRHDRSIIEGIPKNGVLGFIAERNPDVTFISTGGTYNEIMKANLNVIELSEYTGYPEMESGLVKSLHPKIHAGILGHKYTESDAEFIREHNIRYFDAVIVNFYALDKMINTDGASFEMIRQAIDIGGPTMSHNARKAFISTTLITSPKEYPILVEELDKYNGAISLKARLNFAKAASRALTEYLLSVDRVLQSLTYDDLARSYDIINKP